MAIQPIKPFGEAASGWVGGYAWDKSAETMQVLIGLENNLWKTVIFIENTEAHLLRPGPRQVIRCGVRLGGMWGDCG